MSNSDRPTATNESCLALSAKLGEILRSRGWSIATAESCSGGGIALALTRIAGASDYVRGGVVAYANDIKQHVLGVDPKTLATVGAVSDDCARQMAAGARQLLGVDIALSSTGIAGPTGATARKPVGLVYIAAATTDTIISRELHLTGDRAAIMDATVSSALELALETLEQDVMASQTG